MTSTARGAALTGYTVAVTDPALHDVAAALRVLGASALDMPVLQIVPGHLDGLLRNATRRLIRRPADYVVVASAAGWRRWHRAAAAWGLSAALDASLRRATVLPAATLAGLPPLPVRVAVVVDEQVPAWLLDRLRGKEIDLLVVPALRLGPPLGLAPLHRLARMVIQREVHAITFATAIAAGALIDVTERSGRGGLLLRALATDVVVAAADEESAGPLVRRDIEVEVAREGLADLVCAALLARRREFLAGGLHFVVQGDVVLAGAGVAIRLPPRPAAVMRSLADYPGRTLSRTALEQLAPLARPSGVEQAVRQLRARLGEYAWLVATVNGRGYRLAVG